MPGHKRWLLLLMVGFVLCAGAAKAAGTLAAPDLLVQAAKPVHHVAKERRVNAALIRRYRAKAWRWQRLAGAPQTYRAVRPHTMPVLKFWMRTARRAYVTALNPPHKGAWLCIHRYEGSWSDSNDPYWGGLQMDRGFMQAHAPSFLLRRGYADRWTPLEQMWVAERAYRSGRGFSPWPNTARLCGVY